jgi:predicted dienelactone hydrolase
VDAKRDRKVPVKIYYPADAKGRLPVIIFSHGLGGSREGYGYLGKYWASHGYVSVHPQHLGSDTSVWQSVPLGERMQALTKAAYDVTNAINRPLDISFVIDELAKLNAEDSPLKERLDLERIGMAGHSFGAYTTLAVAGQVFMSPEGKEISDREPRIKAAIPMSAPVPKSQEQVLDKAFAKINIPCFHMTGTLDDSPVGETKAAQRRIPFDHIQGTDEFLLIFNGGDHMVFSGRLRAQGGGEKDQQFQALVCSSSTAFWDAYLKGDEKAKKWLTGKGFETELGDKGTFEKKLKGAPSASK